MCLFHKWTKWTQYKASIPERRITKNWGLSAAIEYRQFKACTKCGKIKDVLIRTEALD